MQVKRLWIPILTLIVIAGTYFATECAFSAPCGETWAMRDLARGVFDPVFLYSLWMLPISLLILFVSQTAFKTWAKFTFIWLLVSMLLLSAFDIRAGGWFNILPITRVVATWPLAFLYFFFSLIILGLAHMKTQKVSK